MPTVTIQFPPPNFTVPHGQPLHVGGIATGSGGGEPVLVSDVGANVDGGPTVEATTKTVAHQTVPTVTFAASVDVPEQPGLHTVTVVATDGNRPIATASVQVLRDVTVVVPAPAILIDIEPPMPTPADDPSVQGLISTVQKALLDAASRLASTGLVVAGPNVIAATDADNIDILRLGIWLVDPSFPLVAPAPPDFPLPRLTAVEADAGFALVPPLRRGHRIGFTDTPFGLRIPQTTLQHLADVALAAAGSSDVKSISVTLTEPDTAATVISGSHFDIGFSITVTETLSVAPLTDADPPQAVPHIDVHHDSDLGGLPDWLIGAVIPILDVVLLIGSLELAQGSDEIPGLVSTLIDSVPARVPLSNTSLPPQARDQFDFPQIVLDWAFFGIHDQAVEGAGDAIVVERDQAHARVHVAGPSSLQIQHGEVDVATTYNLQLSGIRPDAGQLTWRLHPPAGKDDTGTGSADVFAQSATVDLDFQVPLHAQAGTFPFTISAAARETCGTDPTKILTATDSETIDVRLH